MKNLFDYATKELSQDAFLRWLLENDTVSEIAKDYLGHFGVLDEDDVINSVHTYAQWRKIDITAILETEKRGKVALFIEDKTFSGEHSNQLMRYNESIKAIVEYEKVKEENVHKLFYKTSIIEQDEIDRVEEAGWNSFSISEINEFWEKYCSHNNLIIHDYANHIKSVYDASFNVDKPSKNDNLIAWKSYFDRVVIPEFENKSQIYSAIGQYDYSYLVLQPESVNIHECPYLEVRSRDCTENRFNARILLFNVEISEKELYEIKEELKKRESIGFFRCYNGKKQIAKMMNTERKVVNDQEFIEAVNEAYTEYIEVLKKSGVIDKLTLENQALEHAKSLAKKQFTGKTDKSGVDYYEGHLTSAASLVKTNKAKIVAYLHDLLEDTDYPEDKLRKEFGDEIVDAVVLLTHKGKLDEEEYLAYIRKLKESKNALAITVKIADLTNNSDYTRLGALSPKDLDEDDFNRYLKYQKALKVLQS